ncbi:diacylglycerol kinase [Natronospora cellulosivora (SeqCode)]
MHFDRLLDSFNYALAGLVHTFKTQRNMKIHFTISFLVLLASLFVEITKTELIIIFFAISLVIALELINTAIEVIIDMIAEEYRYRAKITKNIAASAVLIASMNAIIVAYLIFLDDIRTLSIELISQIKQEPIHFIFINLALLFIVIVVLKAKKGHGTPLEGGMPSGHSALSFSILTLVIYFTEDMIVISLVFFLALLVAQSRLQSRAHNFLEIMAGALIGIIFTMLILLII